MLFGKFQLLSAIFKIIIDFSTITIVGWDLNLRFIRFKEISLILTFSKSGLTTGLLGFESFPPDSFWRSLQSKETQKVHQHFCPENRKIGLRNSCVAALKPVFEPKKPEKPRKTPKGRKKNAKCRGRQIAFL